MSDFAIVNDDALKSGNPSLSLGDANRSQLENDNDALSTSSLGASNSSPRRTTESTDRYGFYVSDESRTMATLSEQEMRFRKQKEAERTKKWLKMINNWERTLNSRKEKLKRRLRKGVPDSLRSQVWSRLCESWRYKKKFDELADHDPEALPIAVQTIEDVSEVYIGYTYKDIPATQVDLYVEGNILCLSSLLVYIVYRVAVTLITVPIFTPLIIYHHHYFYLPLIFLIFIYRLRKISTAPSLHTIYSIVPALEVRRAKPHCADYYKDTHCLIQMWATARGWLSSLRCLLHIWRRKKHSVVLWQH